MRVTEISDTTDQMRHTNDEQVLHVTKERKWVPSDMKNSLKFSGPAFLVRCG